MITAWTRNLKSSEDIHNFEDALKAAKPVLERLQQLIDQSIVEVDNQELSSKAYDTPNWSHKQAHLNGFKSALKLVSKLITPDKGKQ